MRALGVTQSFVLFFLKNVNRIRSSNNHTKTCKHTLRETQLSGCYSFLYWTSTHSRLFGASEELEATNEVKKKSVREEDRGRCGRGGGAERCKDTAGRRKRGREDGGMDGGTHGWVGGCCIYFFPCDSGTAASSMRHNKRKMETKQHHLRLFLIYLYTLGLLRFTFRELKCLSGPIFARCLWQTRKLPAHTASSSPLGCP